MGTRGLFGVHVDGVTKVGYNQFDSYPDGQGLENLRWLRALTSAQLEEYKRKARSVVQVKEDQDPTPEQLEQMKAAGAYNGRVSTGTDWYSATRETHGHIGKQLDLGVMLDSYDFGFDSLFCEWGYVWDIDADVFEVYTGFQKSSPERGKWRGDLPDRMTNEEHPSEYSGIKLLASFGPVPSGLPSDEDFLEHLRRLEEGAGA